MKHKVKLAIGGNLHRFGTVVFNSTEQDCGCEVIAIDIKGNLNRFRSSNKYNPSSYRDGMANYYWSEADNQIRKVCSYQHKGIEFIDEIEIVSESEILDLFGRTSYEITGVKHDSDIGILDEVLRAW